MKEVFGHRVAEGGSRTRHIYRQPEAQGIVDVAGDEMEGICLTTLSDKDDIFGCWWIIQFMAIYRDIRDRVDNRL